jgi:hypothetical protein
MALAVVAVFATKSVWVAPLSYEIDPPMPRHRAVAPGADK